MNFQKEIIIHSSNSVLLKNYKKKFLISNILFYYKKYFLL